LKQFADGLNNKNDMKNGSKNQSIGHLLPVVKAADVFDDLCE